MTDVPIIDFAVEGSGPGKARVAKGIRNACEGTGSFYLAGHGVPAAQPEEIFTASRRFFALPLAERMRVKLTPRTSTPMTIPTILPARNIARLRKGARQRIGQAFHLSEALALDLPEEYLASFYRKPLRQIGIGTLFRHS
jgi:isopenicillin N synthase-like dioxygenase